MPAITNKRIWDQAKNQTLKGEGFTPAQIGELKVLYQDQGPAQYQAKYTAMRSRMAGREESSLSTMFSTFQQMSKPPVAPAAPAAPSGVPPNVGQPAAPAAPVAQAPAAPAAPSGVPPNVGQPAAPAAPVAQAPAAPAAPSGVPPNVGQPAAPAAPVAQAPAAPAAPAAQAPAAAEQEPQVTGLPPALEGRLRDQGFSEDDITYLAAAYNSGGLAGMQQTANSLRQLSSGTQPFEVPEYLQGAMDRIQESLDRGGFQMTEAERQQIVDYYMKPYLAQGDRNAEKVKAYFRSIGLTHSGRHGEALISNLDNTSRQIAEHVTVPLAIQERQAEEESRRWSIQQLASLGQQAYQMELQAAEMSGFFRGSPTAAMKIAQMPYEHARRMAEGWTYTDPETGEERRVYGDQEFQRMTLTETHRITVEGFDYTDEAGNVVHVMGSRELADEDWLRSEDARVGYRRVMLDPVTGEPMRDEHGNLIIEEILGRDGLERYRLELDDSFRRAGLASDEARFYAGLSLEEKKHTGSYFTIDTPDGPKEVWVNGSVGLEEAKIAQIDDLTQRGWDHETAERVADQEYDENKRLGYMRIDPRTGEAEWVVGTEGHENSLIHLRSKLGIEEMGASHSLSELTRNGYSQQVDITDAEGNVIGTQVIHVSGTEEFAEGMADKDWRYREMSRIGYYTTDKNGEVVWVEGTEEFTKTMQEDAQEYGLSIESVRHVYNSILQAAGHAFDEWSQNDQQEFLSESADLEFRHISSENVKNRDLTVSEGDKNRDLTVSEGDLNRVHDLTIQEAGFEFTDAENDEQRAHALGVIDSQIAAAAEEGDKTRAHDLTMTSNNQLWESTERELDREERRADRVALLQRVEKQIEAAAEEGDKGRVHDLTIQKAGFEFTDAENDEQRAHALGVIDSQIAAAAEEGDKTRAHDLTMTSNNQLWESTERELDREERRADRVALLQRVEKQIEAAAEEGDKGRVHDLTIQKAGFEFTDAENAEQRAHALGVIDSQIAAAAEEGDKTRAHDLTMTSNNQLWESTERELDREERRADRVALLQRVEKQIEAAAEEGDKGRVHDLTIQKAGFEFTDAENAEQRAHALGVIDSQIAAAAEEGDKGRAHDLTITSNNQLWESTERELDREERRADRVALLQRVEKQIEAAAEEGDKGRVHDLTIQKAGFEFTDAENAEQRQSVIDQIKVQGEEARKTGDHSHANNLDFLAETLQGDVDARSWQSGENALNRENSRTLAAINQDNLIETIDYNSRIDLRNVLMGGVANLAAEGLQWALGAINGNTSLSSWVTGGGVFTAAEAAGVTLTADEANQISEIYNKSFGDENIPGVGMADSTRDGVGALGRGVRRFGSYIITGLGVGGTGGALLAGAAIGGGVLLAGYLVFQGDEDVPVGLTPEESAYRWYESLTPEEQAEVDELFGDETEWAFTSEFDANYWDINANTGYTDLDVLWSPLDTRDKGKRQKGGGDQPFRLFTGGVRRLLDSGIFQKDAADLTGAELRLVRETWDHLGPDLRSSPPQGAAANDVRYKLYDLAHAARSYDVWDNRELRQNFGDLKTLSEEAGGNLQYRTMTVVQHDLVRKIFSEMTLGSHPQSGEGTDKGDWWRNAISGETPEQEIARKLAVISPYFDYLDQAAG